MGRRLLVGRHTALPPLPGREVVRATRDTPLEQDMILIGGKTLIECLQHDPVWETWKISYIDYPYEADVYFFPNLSDWEMIEERVEAGWCRKKSISVTIYYRTYQRRRSTDSFLMV
jgi:dihydrofolate reductase